MSLQQLYSHPATSIQNGSSTLFIACECNWENTGLDVGDFVGVFVGWDVVGLELGSDVIGLVEGPEVGLVVGEAVGNDEGELVG